MSDDRPVYAFFVHGPVTVDHGEGMRSHHELDVCVYAQDEWEAAELAVSQLCSVLENVGKVDYDLFDPDFPDVKDILTVNCLRPEDL